MPTPTPQLDPNSFTPKGGAQASASISSLPDNAAGSNVASTQQNDPAGASSNPSMGASSESQFQPGQSSGSSSESQFSASPQGVQLDDQSFQPANQGGQGDEQPGLISRIGETSGITPGAQAIAAQATYAVERPADVLTQAIDQFSSGDWKGGIDTASKIVNGAAGMGIDNNSPIYKAAEQLIMHPVNAIKDQYAEARKGGQNPLSSVLSTVAHTVTGTPNPTEVQNTIDSVKSNYQQGNLAGAAGAAINGVTNSDAIRSIPIVGDQIAQVGSLEGKDLHDHNYMAAIGDVLGPLLTLGAGKLLGGLGEAAGASGTTEAGADATADAGATTGVPPPPGGSGTPPPPVPAGQVASTYDQLKPTTAKISGIKVPQVSESPLAMKLRTLASKKAAKDFVTTRVQPAARAALQSNFAKSAMNSADELRAIRGDASTRLSPPKSPLFNLDKTTQFLKDEAQVTYKKLDAAAKADQTAWDEEWGDVEQPTPEEIEAGASPIEVPERPSSFTELQDQLRRADRTIKSTSPLTTQVERETALRNYPRFKAEMGHFIDMHQDVVGRGELDAADKVRAQAERYSWLADKIRTATKGKGAGETAGTTGKDIKISESTLDSLPSQFDNEFGADGFKKLVGQEGLETYNKIIKALQQPKTGGRVLDFLNAIPWGIGKTLGSLPANALVDNLLFNADFGKTALKAFDSAKAGGTYARNAARNVGKTAVQGVVTAGATNPATMQNNPADLANKPNKTMDAVQGALSRNPKKGKPLTALASDSTASPAASPSSNPVTTAQQTISQLPQEIQDATSSIPVQVTKGQQMTDPNGRANQTVEANVDQGAGSNSIEINNPQAASNPATMAHELVHVWQNNLPPSVQAKIPDDAKDMSAFDISNADSLRKQGKTLSDLPREQAATIVQKYIEDPKKNANLKPWVQDMGKTALSSTQPTAPNATKLNMTPRAPGLPSGVAGLYPTAKKKK